MASGNPIERRLGDRVPVNRFQADLSGKENVLYVAFEMDDADLQRLEGALLDRYIVAYMDSIDVMLAALHCTASPRRPSGPEMHHLRQLVQRDAQSIAGTFNAWLKRHIQRLHQSNPSWTRAQFTQALENAQQGFIAGKNKQVIRATKGNATVYGQKRFIEANNLQSGRFTWHATPAIVFSSHRECIERVRAGAVPWEIAQKWDYPHPNCRHEIRLSSNTTVNCDAIWRG